MESTITPQLATNSAETIERYQFLSFNYWFGTPSAASLNHWGVALLAVLSTLLLIFVAVVIAIKLLNTKLNPPQQKFLTKALAILSPFGPIGWVLVLSRVYGVVFFSARFWWVLWFFGLVLSGFWLFRERQKLPQQQSQFRAYQLKKRYFPKKKR